MTHYVTIQETTERVYKLDIPRGFPKEDILDTFVYLDIKPKFTTCLDIHVVTAVPDPNEKE